MRSREKMGSGGVGGSFQCSVVGGAFLRKRLADEGF